MKVLFTAKAWDDLIWWHTQDKANVGRVLEVINDCGRDPYQGIGKPEPLKYLKPCWSRRIDKANRLIYETAGKGATHQLIIVACRGHYES
jgi:toxin YoeB